jgi:FAD/FMN-containing dehydrogenase
MTTPTPEDRRGDGGAFGAQHLESFRQVFRGELIHADHPGYEAARRVWNGNIDRRPALIARCTGVADVQGAVNFARAHDLRVSVRGGGHSAPGYGTNDGGFVIDLSPMKGIHVDPQLRTARAEAGVLWRDWTARRRCSDWPPRAARSRIPASLV